MKTFIVSAVLAASVAAAGASYRPKYQITVTADKRIDYSRFKTYTWMDTHPARVAAIDAQIVAAVERELGALGMTRVASGPGDVVATYASFTRTDVNVKAKPLNGTARPEYSVGVLVVSLLDPESLQPLLKIRADKPVDAAGLDATISATVGEMFKRYPIRRRH